MGVLVATSLGEFLLEPGREHDYPGLPWGSKKESSVFLLLCRSFDRGTSSFFIPVGSRNAMQVFCEATS